MAVAYAMAIAFQAVVGAMVSGILAVDVPAERRSATLNLIFLPLYLGGIAGPALGSTVVGAGLRAVFYLAAVVLAFGLVVAIMFARRGTGAGRAQAATAVERAEPAD
jgi:MFS family permease